MKSDASNDIWDILNRNVFFVKDAVKMLEAKQSDKFDIYDPNTQELLFECREPNLGTVTRMRRLAGGKYDVGSPFNLEANVPGTDQQLLRVARNAGFLSLGSPPVEFYDHENQPISVVKKKFLSLFAQRFQFFSPQKTLQLELCAKPIISLELTRKASYNLVAQKKVLATIAPKWKGAGSAYFRQGFKSAISIAEDIPQNSPVRQLLIAFSISVQRILK
jgi:hypothetical protein